MIVDGRLLTGFPVIFGELKGAPTDMRYRQVSSTEVALALYFDLAVFKQWPQVLDEPKSAYFFAERFLTGELADQYLVGCTAGCGTDLPYPGWTGGNEFEREATYRQFRKTIVPELMARAPSFPIGIKHVIEVELGAYDRARQVFPLRLVRPGSNWDPHFGTMGAARRIHVAEEYQFPKELPVAASEAQALLSGLAGGRNAYLALDQRLDQPDWNTDRDAPRLKMIVERARLYADAGLGDQLHEFVDEGRSVVDAPQADKAIGGPMKVDYWRDSVLIGGRVVTTIGGLSERMEDAPEGLDARTNIVPLVRDYALVDDPTWLEHDRSGLELVFQLDAPLRAEIIEEAIGRPLADHEKISLQHSGGYPVAPVAGDPFAERRAVEALRKRADQVVPTQLPPQPIPLRVYCFADIGRYEFANQSFPITRHGCDGAIEGIDWSGGARGAPSAEGEIPASLPLPPEEAEAFAATIEGSSRVTVSFETDLTIKASKSEAGFRRLATLSPRSHFWIHAPRHMTETLYRLDKPAPAADADGDQAQPGATIAGDPGRVWDLQQVDQRAALLEFAQPMGSLPYDGRALLSGADGNYGIAVGRSGPFNPSSDDPGTSGPFFGSPHIDYVPALSNALAVPREYLLNMAYVDDEREPMSGIVALLPAPYDSFVRTAQVGSYGQSQMVFETSLEIVGIHRFEIAFAKPLIVLSVRPKSARFMTNDSDKRRPLETFDLTTAISFSDYEVLAVPSRVTQVVAAAEALGSNVGEVVGNTMRWPDGGNLDVFQKQDFVARLVEAGRTSKPDDTLWVTGTLNIGEYDFATQSFPPNSVSLEPIEVMRSLDLPLSSVGLQMGDASPFAIRMTPEEARTFAQAYPPHSIVPLRARIRTSSPTLQHRSIGFSIEILEAELLTPNSVPTVRDRERIVYSYPMSTPAVSPPNEDEMADTEESDEPEPAHEPAGRDILGVQLFQSVELGSAEDHRRSRNARDLFRDPRVARRPGRAQPVGELLDRYAFACPGRADHGGDLQRASGRRKRRQRHHPLADVQARRGTASEHPPGARQGEIWRALGRHKSRPGSLLLALRPGRRRQGAAVVVPQCAELLGAGRRRGLRGGTCHCAHGAGSGPEECERTGLERCVRQPLGAAFRAAFRPARGVHSASGLRRGNPDCNYSHRQRRAGDGLPHGADQSRRRRPLARRQ